MNHGLCGWSGAGPEAGGALQRLRVMTVAGTVAPDITFRALPLRYSALLLHFQGRGDVAALNASVRMQFNDDTSLSYDHLHISDNAGAAASGTGVAGDSYIFLGNMPGGTASVNNAGAIECTFLNYAGTVFNKCCLSQNLLDQSQTLATLFAYAGGGLWRNVAPITTIKLFPATGNFAIGTTAVVYGIV